MHRSRQRQRSVPRSTRFVNAFRAIARCRCSFWDTILRRKSINENAPRDAHNDTDTRTHSTTFRNQYRTKNKKRAVNRQHNWTIQESFSQFETKGVLLLFYFFKLPTGVRVFRAITTTALFDRLRQFSRRKRETMLGRLVRRCRFVWPVPRNRINGVN